MRYNKKVFVSGHFNVLHPGHLRLLRFAKECGDHLVVAVVSDRIAGRSAHVSEQLRLDGVNSNSWIDEAVLIDEPVNVVINRIRPDVVVKGKEHQERYNPEKEIVESYGGKLLFSSGESIFSSLDLLRKEFHQSTMDDISIPYDYLSRHGISTDRLITLIKKISTLRVCVVGDVIVDEYITCEPLGMSQEDPTIVVTPVDTTKFIGGAGIVAAHAAGMGAEVEFVTVSGVDSACEYVRDALLKAGVNAHMIEDESRPTTVKQRYRSKGKSLLRVSYLHQTAINSALQNKVMDICSSFIDGIDLLVFSDFNYGCLPQLLVNELSALARHQGVMMAADSQSSSQVGDIARFSDMDLITPTEREARISARNHEDGLVVLAEELQSQSLAHNILLKIGEEGFLIHAGNSERDDWLTDRIPALNSAPRDVAGAGDSLLISCALTLACGGNIWESAAIGALAAAIQVGRVGNTPLNEEELLGELLL